MKETPLIFNGEMVRSILDNRKRITRRLDGLEKLNRSYYKDRISKVEYRDGLWHFWEVGHGSSALPVFSLKCPFGVPGDRIWVKETWQYFQVSYTEFGKDVEEADAIPKNGDPSKVAYAAVDKNLAVWWRPSIHMPRWASRITLEITGVRVERLQEISEWDAAKEGVEIEPGVSCISKFKALWTFIYGTDSWESWESNPWVWCISFKLVEEAK